MAVRVKLASLRLLILSFLCFFFSLLVCSLGVSSLSAGDTLLENGDGLVIVEILDSLFSLLFLLALGQLLGDLQLECGGRPA